MPDKSKWMDPRFLITLGLVVLGGYGTYIRQGDHLKRLQGDHDTLVVTVDDLKTKIALVDAFDAKVNGMGETLSRVLRLTVKIAEKNGISVEDLLP